MCYPCVRTPVTLDSGLNSGRGVGGEGDGTRQNNGGRTMKDVIRLIVLPTSF